MKESIAIAIIFVCASLSCNDAAETQPAETPTGTGSMVRCYAYTKNRDTVLLTIHRDGQQVTGNMLYQLYEKDRNRGSLRGEMKADTLVAEYTFQSEGTQSVRQVAFLQKDATLVEGFGPMEEKGGQLRFSNTAGLDFSGFSLVEVPCKSIDPASAAGSIQQ